MFMHIYIIAFALFRASLPSLVGIVAIAYYSHAFVAFSSFIRGWYSLPICPQGSDPVLSVCLFLNKNFTSL